MSAKVSTLLVAVWLVVTWRDAHSAALPIAPVTHVSGDTPETGFQWVQTDVRGKRDVFPSQVRRQRLCEGSSHKFIQYSHRPAPSSFGPTHLMGNYIE